MPFLDRPSRVLRRIVPAILGLLISATPVLAFDLSGVIPTPGTREVATGAILVDGTYLPAPFTLVYGLEPSGVYVGGLRVLDDPALYERIGFTTEPPRESMGGNEAQLGSRLVPPAESDASVEFRRVAAQIVSALLGWQTEGLTNGAIQEEFGRFLWRDAPVSGADIQGAEAELYLDDVGQTYLSVGIDSLSLSRLAEEVGSALALVAAAADSGGVFVDGRLRRESAIQPVEAALIERGDRAAAAALRAVWGRKYGASIGASAVRSAIPDVSLPAGSETGDVVLLRDAADRLAFFSDGASIERVAASLGEFGAGDVAPSASEVSVRFQSRAFAAPEVVIQGVSEAAGIRVDGARWVAQARRDLESSGGRLWRTQWSLPAAGAWAVPSSDACILPTSDGVVAIRWSKGEVRWRWSGGDVPHPPVVTPDGRVVFVGTDVGAITAIEVRSGRVLWSVYPSHRQPPLRGRLPMIRTIAATNDVAVVARADSEFLVLDRGSAGVRARVVLGGEPKSGIVPKQGVAVAWHGGAYGFDRSGSLEVARPLHAFGNAALSEANTTPVVGRRVGERRIFELSGGLSITNQSLDVVGHVSLEGGTWATHPQWLVIADDVGIRAYESAGHEVKSIPLGIKPVSVIVTDQFAWVLAEGGIAYGVDLKRGSVRRRLDMGDVLTMTGFGIGVVGSSPDATLSGFKLE